MNTVKVISSEIDSLKRRVIKFLRLGKHDVQTSLEAGPFGIDSHPVKDMVAIYSETGERGKTVIVGYLNKNQIADIGEFRTYSTDENGIQKFYIWQKNDGTCEIGGNSHNMVRYSPLEAALFEEVSKINIEFTKLATALNSFIPGLYTQGTVDIDITGSKINEIKTL